MLRLNGVSIVFMPLMFVAGLFGMNVRVPYEHRDDIAGTLTRALALETRDDRWHECVSTQAIKRAHRSSVRCPAVPFCHLMRLVLQHWGWSAGVGAPLPTTHGGILLARPGRVLWRCRLAAVPSVIEQRSLRSC